MLRWCDLVLRAAAPIVPDDIRREWLREWRAEFAYTAARAARLNKPIPVTCLTRALGAIAHAAWLRWDRWRIEMIWQDIKHSMRGLLRKPGFTATVVLTLAIGIGGNAAIFGAVNAVLLRPLPFANPDQLVRVYKTNLAQPNQIGGTVSPPDLVDYRRDNTSFSELAAYAESAYPLTGDGPAEQIPGAQVTGGFFAVMAAAPALGRTITDDDDRPGARDVVVVSHALWARRFGSDPAIVGRQLQINGTSREVVGVMPAGFQFPLQSEVWMPFKFTARDLETQRGAHYINVIARLKPAVSLEAARQDMRRVAARLAGEYPRTNRETSASVHPLREALVGSVRRSMFVLLGAVGLVLLIVCVNIASLVLVRAAGRGRELAVRAAIGAGRASLFRGVLVESALLGVFGGASGLLLAYWATGAIAALDPSVGVPMINQTRLDTTVIAFTLLVSVIAAVVFGTMPAWQATSIADVVSRIREEGGSTTSDPKRQRIRSFLIVAETTLAVVLLVGAGLLGRSFSRLLAVDLGFESASVQTFRVTLPDSPYKQPQQRQDFFDALFARIATHPGVESVGGNNGLPLTRFAYGISTSSVDGRTLSDDEQDALTLQIRLVTPDYFKTMGVAIPRGRAFLPTDRTGAGPVVIVNETAAKRVWKDIDPLGHELRVGTRLGFGGEQAGGTVVGIAADVREFGPTVAAPPTLYLPYAQWPIPYLTVVAKSRGDAASLIEPMRAAVRDLDPDVPIYAVRSMDQLVANAIAQPRLYLLLIASFAGTAMLLAAIGLYGVLAYAVGQRTREIGIRLALGAKRAEVLRMVMTQAGRLAITGIALGLSAAVLASRALRSQLFEIAPTDTLTYVMVGAGLLIVALVASWIPARRAARIDPLAALRHD
ncbi:MAG TPA: ABC transporter permease [Vicinamibacterales bacterium]